MFIYFWLCWVSVGARRIFIVVCRLQLWHMNMWDLSSPTRDWTSVSSIGRRILNHWTTREAPPWAFISKSSCCIDRIMEIPHTHARLLHVCIKYQFSLTTTKSVTSFISLSMKQNLKQISLAIPHSMWEVSSPSRDQTLNPCIGSTGS